MATGRTLNRWARTYINGYALCTYTRSVGPLVWRYDTPDLTTQCDAVQGALPDTPEINSGTLNGVMDGDAAGLFATFNAPGSYANIMIPVGIRAAPAAGDPVWVARTNRLNYELAESGGAMYVNIPLGVHDASSWVTYDRPWGTLLHAASAETAANSATGVDQLAATSYGGYMMYQVTAGDGNATISVESATANADGDFAAVDGLTTGNIDCSAATSGIVATTAKTTTINQYVRWQLALDTATTVTFLLALVRETRPRA